ncbi:hypothetical protein B0H66DRAFT_602688 [Apodospora peruviana]|uniref:Cupin type-2 domain-containing protein n=1 Tax=Apodospora peruviana TaxID=516989 RepID=A0AAE0I4L2_9PEZI|nr:hypothetical protein B0H66DRAFT_602688 [Apodospora peruviana]
MEITVNEAEPEDSINRCIMITTCTAEGDIFHVPPHWHMNHQEWLGVVEGRVEITLDGKPAILKAGDPDVLVGRRVVHSVRAFKGERLVLTEKPDPAGIYKALFFNDLLSKGGFKEGGIWHILRSFYDGDTYLALPLRWQPIDQVFITVFGSIARLFTSRKPQAL